MTIFRRTMAAALAPIARRLTAGYGRIAMFHRLSSAPAFRRVSVESFEWRITYLRHHYHIVPLQEFLQRMRDGDSLRGCVAITFDDGHRDFIECAYPVLVKYQVPATVYLISDFVSRQMWLWSDALYWMVTSAPAGRYQFHVNSCSFESDLMDTQSRNVVWERLADLCMGMTVADRGLALETIAAELGVLLPALPIDSFASMSWAELRSLDPQLVQIGAHTCSHPILSMCSPEEQFAEIDQCRIVIEDQLQRRVDAFCYPNGSRADFNNTTLRVLRDCGFQSAVMSDGGLIAADDDPLMLPRIGAGDRSEEFRTRFDGVDRVRDILRGRRQVRG